MTIDAEVINTAEEQKIVSEPKETIEVSPENKVEELREGTQQLESTPSIMESVESMGIKEEDYDFQLNESPLLSKEITSKFINKAKQIQLNKDQAKEIYNLWNDMIAQDLNKSKSEIEKSEVVLKQEWGDNYDLNMAKAIHAAKKIGGDQLISLLDNTGLGNNPLLIKAFHKISKAVEEDKFIGVNTEPPPPEMKRWNGIPMLKFNM